MKALSTPVRVHLSRKRGWRMPPNTVKVDRSNHFFGNPFKVGVVYCGFLTTDAAHAVSRYERWLKGPYAGEKVPGLAREQLRGKNLGCWCPLGSPCHADVLLKIANA